MAYRVASEPGPSQTGPEGDSRWNSCRTSTTLGHWAVGFDRNGRSHDFAQGFALIPNAYEGYISWEERESIRRSVRENVPGAELLGAANNGSPTFSSPIH